MAADAIPMVPMKSSTGIPLSTWMFLKACSEVCAVADFAGTGGAGTVPACAARWPVHATLVSHTNVAPPNTTLTRLGHTVI